MMHGVPQQDANGVLVGFRVGDSLALEIARAAKRLGRGDSAGSRSTTVQDAFKRGLSLLRAEASARLGDTAAVAGTQQFRVYLTADDVRLVEDLRGRMAPPAGRPPPRVFVIRECVQRGLGDLEPTAGR